MRLDPRAAAVGVRLVAHEVLGSTNAEALKLAREGERGPLWVVAERQAAGRGRRGRVWVSQRGNLFATLLLTAPAAVWQERLARAGVPTGVVKTVREVIADVRASPAVGMPPSIGDAARFPPPRLDEHGGVIRHSGWRVFDSTFGQTDGR